MTKLVFYIEADEQVVDTADFGLEDGEWEQLSDDERNRIVDEWAEGNVQAHYEDAE